MKRILFALTALTAMILIAGCNVNTSTPVAATETSIPEPAPTSIPDLTLDQLKNAEFTIDFGEGETMFTLVDGTYKSTTDVASPDYFEVNMSDTAAFGDLNGDGVGDATVSIGVNMGGSGVFEYIVAFVNEDGQPVQAGYYYVDDRAKIDSLKIENQRIVADALVHGPNDPMCCPSLPIQASLQLPLGNEPLLLLAHQTSEVVPGAFREITITSPEPGTEVDKACTISGKVTIAPFENNLVYHVYDNEMNELMAGPLMVVAPDMGAPGTFDLNIDLSGINYTGTIFVTISDLSAADGSILALDSIVLDVK